MKHPLYGRVSQLEALRRAEAEAPGDEKIYLDQRSPLASEVNLGGSMKQHPLEAHMEKQIQAMNGRLQQQQQILQKEEELLRKAEMRANGGMVENNSAKTLHYNMEQALDKPFMPGNVGDINRVIWPFWFTTNKVTLDPNTSQDSNFTVTQEAAFIVTAYTRAIFVQEQGQPGQFQYIDPDASGVAAKSNNLSFQIRDSQSNRTFMNKPVDVNSVGHWKRPTVLPTPMMFLPNSNIQVTWQNNDSAAVYVPWLTFLGVRLRIDHAKEILSLVQG